MKKDIIVLIIAALWAALGIFYVMNLPKISSCSIDLMGNCLVTIPYTITDKTDCYSHNTDRIADINGDVCIVTIYKETK